MKLLTYRDQRGERLGIRTENGILDVRDAGLSLGKETPGDIMRVLEAPEEALDILRHLEKNATDPSMFRKEDEVAFEPCVTRPEKIICVGLNYRAHALETGKPIPDTPILFSKFNNALNGHGGDVRMPETAGQVDYEAELCIVIGAKACNVDEEEALNCVFGYTAANDVSARDLQYRTPQWLLGKTPDGFAPIGPYLVTADEIGDPNDLSIECYVNGERRQQSNTSDMIFSCARLVSYISQHMTLKPGDLILTGTPDGVIAGYPPEKRVFLRDGDVTEVVIGKVGRLKNRFVR